MKHHIAAATPNGSGNAPTYRHGSLGKNDLLMRKWVSVLITVFALFFFAQSWLMAAESERVEIGEISAFVGDCKVDHATAGIGAGMQTGAPIYVGDIIKTGQDGSIELVFGVNNRLRLSANTEIRISNLEVSKKEHDGYTRVTSMIEILLRFGEMRVRVRENLVTPAPIKVIAANTQVVLPRSDLIIRRPRFDAGDNREIEAVLAWGRAVFNAKIAGESNWNKEADNNVVAPGECRVPVEPPADYLFKWQKINEESKAMDEVKKLPFSVDELKGAPKDTPVVSPEMQGA